MKLSGSWFVLWNKGEFSLRKNIGLLINDLNTPFTSEAVKGAELGARAIDANMYIFPGMYLDNTLISDDHLQYEYQYNTLFQFAMIITWIFYIL